MALGLTAATHRLQLFRRADRDAMRCHESSPAAAMLVPLLVLMVSMIVTAVFSSGFDWLYPVRVVATATALLCFRRVYARWDWRVSPHSVAIGVVVFVMWLALEAARPHDGAALSTAVASLGEAQAVLWLAFRVLESVVIVPIAEELAFRGYLFRRLIASDFEHVGANQFTWLSLIVSSLAFGLLHDRWIAGTLAGMAYAFAFYRRGRLGDAIAAHMTTNGLIACSVIALGYWSLWS